MANRSLHQINFARLIAKSKDEKQMNQRKKTATTHTSSVYLDKNIIRNKSNKIKSTSLFFKYYEDKLNNWKKKDDSKRKKNNIFYAPHLFKSIQNRLYIMPLWSSVMVGDWQEMSGRPLFKRRLTNNPVESYFKYLKHNILKRKQVCCSELMQKTYCDLELKHKEFFAASAQSSTADRDGENMTTGKKLE